MSDPEALKPARLFIGLWPGPPLRKRLAEEGRRLHTVLGGRLTRAETIHLTLVFIGNLERALIPGLMSELDSLRQVRFEIVFDQARCWSHNRIGYLSPSHAPEAMFRLVSELESALGRLAIPFDRRPYKPHVTLIRKANCPKGNPAQGRVPVSPEWGDVEPITWSADAFVLVESLLTSSGAAYRIIGRFSLS